MPIRSSVSASRPALMVGAAFLMAGGLAIALPAHAATTPGSTSTHKPTKHARNATRHQKKMISKTDPSAVHSNKTSNSQ